MSQNTLTLFYDGLCPLCSREIAHYRSLAQGQPVLFIDITDPQFNAAEHGLDRQRLHEVLHVQLGTGILTGVDAFLALWQTLPGWRWLARLGRLPPAYWLLNLGYRGFAKIRPLLPRLKEPLCLEGTCQR